MTNYLEGPSATPNQICQLRKMSQIYFTTHQYCNVPGFTDKSERAKKCMLLPVLSCNVVDANFKEKEVWNGSASDIAIWSIVSGK